MCRQQTPGLRFCSNAIDWLLKPETVSGYETKEPSLMGQLIIQYAKSTNCLYAMG
jgi:hypothetical protein